MSREVAKVKTTKRQEAKGQPTKGQPTKGQPAKGQPTKGQPGKEAGTKKASRTQSRCPASGKCGGCRYIDVEYKKQLSLKQKKMEELLGRFGTVKPIVGMENPEHYRNKVHAVFHFDRKKGITSGIYEEGTHKVVPVDSCLLENEKADRIIVAIRNMLPSFKIRVYDEDTGYGLFRHVMVRTAHKTGQVMVILVCASPIFPSKNNFVKALLKQFPEISTVVLNVNDKKTSMVLGARNITLYGKGYIEDELCGKLYKLSPSSFYQINSVQTEKLYQKAMEYAGLSRKDVVIDAYCGIGTIGLTAADQVQKVIGVELNEDAVKDAVYNAKRNRIQNADFYCNDAGRFMVNMAERGEHADVVFMDPPRSGSTEAFLDSVMKLAPRKLVYVSCGPDTLARDLAYLISKGKYEVREMTPYDLFPFTEHVETVCLLSKKCLPEK